MKYRVEPRRPSVKQLQPSLIRKLANNAMGREDVIPLWFGEPDQPTPAFVREVAKASLDKGDTFYQPNLGLPLLRRAICEYMNTLYSTQFSMDNIVVTGSGSMALVLAGQCVLAPGDTIVIPAPTWPNLPSTQQILGARVKRVPLKPATSGWQLDLNQLFDACTDETKALLINSPGNPTGWMLSDVEQQAILDFCRERGLWLIADEVYNRIVYDRPYAP
ncbi:MAG TPA: aminotransferase class I/II-fold pyridoxal phosphate-dependent enzyme, partial [Anaerolineae bacterium]|nr:aminotransferase class I/II-fold pyridoxal phosphate-dependent enzyme [Anaerolineae bacterium]